jgi:RNA polymerase sigma-70 factor (ECF subfamily)
MLECVENPEAQGNQYLEDNDLARAAAEGDQDAFAVLVKRHRTRVYAIAFKIVRNEEDALDVTQSVFLRVAGKIGKFRAEGTFRGWLSAIAARMAIDHIRRGSGRREVLTEPEVVDRNPAPAGPGKGNPRAVLDRKMRVEMVDRAMEKLPAQQRAVFVLRYREDMKPKEIAERLGIPGRQVRSQLHRALVRIREMVGEQEPNPPAPFPERERGADRSRASQGRRKSGPA